MADKGKVEGSLALLAGGQIAAAAAFAVESGIVSYSVGAGLSFSVAAATSTGLGVAIAGVFGMAALPATIALIAYVALSNEIATEEANTFLEQGSAFLSPGAVFLAPFSMAFTPNDPMLFARAVGPLVDLGTGLSNHLRENVETVSQSAFGAPDASSELRKLYNYYSGSSTGNASSGNGHTDHDRERPSGTGDTRSANFHDFSSQAPGKGDTGGYMSEKQKDELFRIGPSNETPKDDGLYKDSPSEQGPAIHLMENDHPSNIDSSERTVFASNDRSHEGGDHPTSDHSRDWAGPDHEGGDTRVA